jgi:hypothetical protein
LGFVASAGQRQRIQKLIEVNVLGDPLHLLFSLVAGYSVLQGGAAFLRRAGRLNGIAAEGADGC